LTEPSPRSPGREALLVWLKFLGLLAAVFVFGLIIFELRRAL
jgi:hypothetical protein